MKLILDEVVVRYPDGTVVGPWSHSFEAGLFHLVGPNGAGKSSLMAAVAGAIPRLSGAVSLDGQDPEHLAACRARIGLLTAQPSLPGFLTVREAWKMVASTRSRPNWNGEPLEVALALVPDVRLAQCSSGMRQKAELIAALAGDPDLLVLDEPLANLDQASVEWVLQRLERHQGIALVAHHGELKGAVEVQVGDPQGVVNSTSSPSAYKVQSPSGRSVKP